MSPKYLLIMFIIFIAGAIVVVFIWRSMNNTRDESAGILVDAGALGALATGNHLVTPPPSPASFFSGEENISAKRNRLHIITLTTNFGDIAFETFDADAPHAVENFITLAEKKFYDNLTFHRVISGFMIQGGDPSGNGTGGPGYEFADELTAGTESAKLGYRRGIVAMANSGPDTNGSQFFIMHKDYALPHAYTIFGMVVRGMETVDAIAKILTNDHDMPVRPVVIRRVGVEKR